MQYSYSRINTFNQCKYKYYLTYIEKQKVIDNQDHDNALVLGHALHTGIELGVEAGINEYFRHFYITSDLIENEALKLEHWIKEVRKLLPKGKHEIRISNELYIGFADYLVDNGDGTYDLYDFKYSNHVDRYKESGQLSVYRYFLDKPIRKMFYVMIPKLGIRQKKTETLEQFRARLKSELKKKSVEFVEVDYKPEKVIEFLSSCLSAERCEAYPKNETRLCNWCEFCDYCSKGDTYMLLPKSERRNIQSANKKFWIYGEPMSGKTTFCDKMPDPIDLNTDGNIKYVTMPYLPIKDTVTVEGRVENRTYAWETFKAAIDELEKKDNDFKTIIVDLVEDTYEACRIYKCHELGISHESDDSFRAWDKVRSEFLNTYRRLMNLPYENIVLLSHEDKSRDLTKRSGDKVTAIRPAITDKIANKLAGMVDIVARLVVDNGNRSLTFESDEITFGGGRLPEMRLKSCALDWDELNEVYKDCVDRMQKKANQKQAEPVKEDKPEPAVKEEEPVKEDPKPEDLVWTDEKPVQVEEAPKRTRRTRKER